MRTIAENANDLFGFAFDSKTCQLVKVRIHRTKMRLRERLKDEN